MAAPDFLWAISVGRDDIRDRNGGYRRGALWKESIVDEAQRTPLWTPEHQLVAAVLLRSISDYLGWITLQGKEERKEQLARHIRKQAKAWIFEKNSERIFSFEYCCDVLGLEPDSVRELLKTRPWSIDKVALDGFAQTAFDWDRGRESERERKNRLFLGRPKENLGEVPGPEARAVALKWVCGE